MFFSSASLSSRHSKYSQKETCSAFLAFALLSQINPMPTYIPFMSLDNLRAIRLHCSSATSKSPEYIIDTCAADLASVYFRSCITTNICVLASLLLLYCSNYLKHLHALFFCISATYAVRAQNTSSVLWNVEQLSKLADSDQMCCLSCIYQF